MINVEKYEYCLLDKVLLEENWWNCLVWWATSTKIHIAASIQVNLLIVYIYFLAENLIFQLTNSFYLFAAYSLHISWTYLIMYKCKYNIYSGTFFFHCFQCGESFHIILIRESLYVLYSSMISWNFDFAVEKSKEALINDS